MDTNFLQYREWKTIVGGIHTTAVYFLLVLNIGYVTAHVRERVAPVLVLPPLASCAFRVLLIAYKAYCSLTPFRLSHPSKPVWFLSLAEQSNLGVPPNLAKAWKAYLGESLIFFVIFFGSAGVSCFNANWKAW